MVFGKNVIVKFVENTKKGIYKMPDVVENSEMDSMKAMIYYLVYLMNNKQTGEVLIDFAEMNQVLPSLDFFVTDLPNGIGFRVVTKE
jgi:hypothetical protein